MSDDFVLMMRSRRRRNDPDVGRGECMSMVPEIWNYKFCRLSLNVCYSGRMETKRLIEAASAIAQTTRMRIVESLVAEGPAGLAAGQLATLVGTPPNTMSTHLAILTRAGVVASDRQGRVIRYRLVDDVLRDIAGHLTSMADAAAVGTPRLRDVGSR